MLFSEKEALFFYCFMLFPIATRELGESLETLDEELLSCQFIKNLITSQLWKGERRKHEKFFPLEAAEEGLVGRCTLPHWRAALMSRVFSRIRKQLSMLANVPIGHGPRKKTIRKSAIFFFKGQGRNRSYLIFGWRNWNGKNGGREAGKGAGPGGKLPFLCLPLNMRRPKVETH